MLTQLHSLSSIKISINNGNYALCLGGKGGCGIVKDHGLESWLSEKIILWIFCEFDTSYRY